VPPTRAGALEPSDVFLFSKLPEADQQVILRRRA
jgi:hypothetical protein